MIIADRISHMALSYISALNQQGYKVSVGELNAYITSPNRRSLLSIALTEPFMKSPFMAESVVDHFQRINWIKRVALKQGKPSNADRVELTKLGSAVLKSLDHQELTAEPSPVIVLKAEDSLSYGRVIAEISRYDDCLLADAYFRIDNLPDLIDYTSCSRILTSEKIGEKSKVALAVSIKNITKKKIEIRVSKEKEFHGRFVIPKSGPVVFIGTSLNSIKRQFSVMGEVSELGAAREIRKKYEKFWDEAMPLR